MLAWALRLDNLRANYRIEVLAWRKSTTEVTAKIGKAIENPDLKWEGVPQQIDLIIQSRDAWKTVAGEQTAAIDAMGLETERLKRLNSELRVKALKAIAKRQTAIDRLESQANDPGDRADCQAQITAANAALDEVWKEGL
jgi:hypothetical protein